MGMCDSGLKVCWNWVADVEMGRGDAELLGRLRALKAELVSRGLPTELGIAVDEEAEDI